MILRKTLKIFLSSVILIILFGFGIYVTLEYQDRNFAARTFHFMTYESVLESRKFHSEVLGCTYAIVALDDTAPTNPPSQWIDPSLWHQTPLYFKEEVKVGQCRNIICECESDWRPDTYKRLTRALSEPGSFYYLGWKQPPHDTLYQDVITVYSPAERVTAMVRFGD